MRSPDASLVLSERWQTLTPEQRGGFAPLGPDLVVELASPGEEGVRGVSALRQKMAAKRANGAQPAWLLLPDEQAVEIWRVDLAEIWSVGWIRLPLVFAGPEFDRYRLILWNDICVIPPRKGTRPEQPGKGLECAQRFLRASLLYSYY